MQSYIPTILFVIVSWVSFWMDVEHVPGRVALGVTTLLTISSKSAGLSSESPQVSYVKVRLNLGSCRGVSSIPVCTHFTVSLVPLST